MQCVAQRQHQGNLRQSFSALPFGDGFVADGEEIRQLTLGKILRFSHLGNKSADPDLVHVCSSFLAHMVLEKCSQEHTRSVERRISTKRRVGFYLEIIA